MSISISRSKAREGQERLSSRYGISTRVNGDGHLVASMADEDKVDSLVACVPKVFGIVKKADGSIIIRVK